MIYPISARSIGCLILNVHGAIEPKCLVTASNYAKLATISAVLVTSGIIFAFGKRYGNVNSGGESFREIPAKTGGEPFRLIRRNNYKTDLSRNIHKVAFVR